MKDILFTESAIGLIVADTYAAAVLVSASGLLNANHFFVQQVNVLNRTDGQSDSALIAEVVKGFSSQLPVIPVALPGISEILSEKTLSGNKTDTERLANAISSLSTTIKPVIESDGDAWIDSRHLFMADTGRTRRTIRILNSTEHTPCPGAVSLAEAVRALTVSSDNPDVFAIVEHSPGFTLIALADGIVLYNRTLYCSPDTLFATVKTAFQALATRHSGLPPVSITWFGMSSTDVPVPDRSSGLPPVTGWISFPAVSINQNIQQPESPESNSTAGWNNPLYSNGLTNTWILAAGAAISWMTNGRKTLLVHAQNRNTGGGVSVVRRTALLLRSAGLLFLMCLLGWMTTILMSETKTIQHLKESAISMPAEQSVVSLPGLPRLPSSLNGLRNHSHLTVIASTAVEHELELSDIRITMNRIEIQGFGADIAGINSFSRELSRHFSGSDAAVLSPVTQRGLSDRLAFRQEIFWSDTP